VRLPLIPATPWDLSPSFQRVGSIEAARPSLAEALCGLAQAERDIGNPKAASHHYANAAVLYRQLGPPARLAYAIRHEADVLREMCHPAEAEPLHLEAAGIYRQLGEKATLDLANTLRGLALVNESAAKNGRLQSALAGGA
jgi:hypothetical protein